MKLRQLHLRDLFWLVLVAACLCGWGLASARGSYADRYFSLPDLLAMAALSSPLWIPIVFLSVFVARERLSPLLLAVFLAFEVLSFALHVGLKELGRGLSH